MDPGPTNENLGSGRNTDRVKARSCDPEPKSSVDETSNKLWPGNTGDSDQMEKINQANDSSGEESETEKYGGKTDSSPSSEKSDDGTG
jgi:hypothetical protein